VVTIARLRTVGDAPWRAGILQSCPAVTMAVPTSLDAWVRVLTLLPIFACSVVGLAITLAKWVQLRRSGEHTLGQARALMGEREYGRAVAVARADRSAVARLIQETLELANGSAADINLTPLIDILFIVQPD